MVIKLLTVFLLVASAYLGWWALSAASFLWLLPSVVLLVAAVGLFQASAGLNTFGMS